MKKHLFLEDFPLIYVQVNFSLGDQYLNYEL